ncbi:diguanylate cyclase [Vibrio sp. FNV 38]|nr:diguanylate cyclase [Vibrio sp. FNV 38]
MKQKYIINKRSLSTVLLLMLTIVTYSMNQVMQREFNLFDYPLNVITDSDFNDGESFGYAQFIEGEGLHFECVLIARFDWPFCELQLDLQNTLGKGVNLNSYTDIFIKAVIDKDGIELEDDAIRLYFKHFSPDVYHSLGFKPNLIEYAPYRYPQGATLPLDYLQVPDWWRAEHPVDVMDSQRELSEIGEVSLSTPANATPGLYTLTIKEFNLIGPWIPYDQLSNALLLIWLMHGLFNLVYSFQETRRENLLLSWEYKQLQNENSHLIGLAHTDKLTGALNRHGAHKVIFEQTPVKSVISIIYLDIDHFKMINDTHSHKAGDTILIMLANTIESTIEEDHRLVRWGGEEFVLLCNDISAYGAEKMAKKLQDKFTQVDWPYVERITCSFGIATCKDIQHFNKAIERADRALYRAKALGRDRVEIAVEDT